MCRGGVKARYRSGLAAPAAMTRCRGIDPRAGLAPAGEVHLHGAQKIQLCLRA